MIGTERVIDRIYRETSPHERRDTLNEHRRVCSDKATAMAFAGAEGEEFWIGLQNFYVITRYNHSPLYAMAVYQLSEELKRRLSS